MRDLTCLTALTSLLYKSSPPIACLTTSSANLLECPNPSARPDTNSPWRPGLDSRIFLTFPLRTPSPATPPRRLLLPVSQP